MDIHKPKPWHGFREFFKEYLIIVVGVLTALGAEQVVESLHWRHQVKEGRAAISADHKRILGYLGKEDTASACVSRRLDELEAILERATSDGRLPPLGDIESPPRQSWTMRGWDGLVSGQTLAHLEPQDAARYTAQAAMLTYLRAAQNDEIDEWSVLRTMVGVGRRLNDAEAANLRAALARARTNAFRLRNAGDQLGGMVIDSRLLTKAEVDAAWQVGANSRADICGPIMAVGAPRLETLRLLVPPAPPSQSYDTALDPIFRR